LHRFPRPSKSFEAAIWRGLEQAKTPSLKSAFFGSYRGPAWETTTPAAAATAAVHGAPHPADPHAHGKAHLREHEVTHGPAEPHDETDADEDRHGHAAAHDAGIGAVAFLQQPRREQRRPPRHNAARHAPR